MDCDDEYYIGKIETDVRRTFPTHPFFFESNGSGVQALRNVLQAYSVKNPRIGYCQGMNFLVGVLLLNMKEESAFWTLDMLMRDYYMEGFFGEKIINLNRALNQFALLIEAMLPEIHEHFATQCIQVSMFASPWFHTLFAYDGQLTFVFRLWDIFLSEGFSIIFRVALAILKESQNEILSMNDEKVIPYIKSAPQQVSDPDLILAAALKIPKNKLMTKIYTEEELESSGMNDLKARKAMMEKDIAKKGITKVGRFFSTKSLSISRRKDKERRASKTDEFESPQTDSPRSDASANSNNNDAPNHSLSFSARGNATREKEEAEEIKQIAKARRNKSSDSLNQNEVKPKDHRPRQRSNDSSARPVIKLNLKDLKKDAEKEQDANNESVSPTSKSPRKSPKTRTSSVTSSNSLSKDSPKTPSTPLSFSPTLSAISGSPLSDAVLSDDDHYTNANAITSPKQSNPLEDLNSLTNRRRGFRLLSDAGEVPSSLGIRLSTITTTSSRRSAGDDEISPRSPRSQSVNSIAKK
jgi:hypothetical protein